MDGFHIKDCPVPANHSEMCKFKTSNEVGYKRASAYIKGVMKSSMSKSTAQNPGPGQIPLTHWQSALPSSTTSQLASGVQASDHPVGQSEEVGDRYEVEEA